MFPNLSRADTEAIELRFQALRDEAARHRLHGSVPITSRGWDSRVSPRQTLTVLLGIGLLALVLLQPWNGLDQAVAEAPPSAVTVAAEAPAAAGDLAVGPGLVSGP